MNGTTFKRVITRPFTTPTSPPTRIPLNNATEGGKPALIASAVTTPVKAIVDPTARSIPPLMMIIVMPIAPIATITVCERTMRRLFGERNRPGVSIKQREDADDQQQTEHWSKAIQPVCNKPMLKKVVLFYFRNHSRR